MLELVPLALPFHKNKTAQAARYSASSIRSRKYLDIKNHN